MNEKNVIIETITEKIKNVQKCVQNMTLKIHFVEMER
jgi:hypothetical protein